MLIENQQSVINFLKKSLEELRNVTDKLEIDIHSKDETIQDAAIYLAVQFLLGPYESFFNQLRNFNYSTTIEIFPSLSSVLKEPNNKEHFTKCLKKIHEELKLIAWNMAWYFDLNYPIKHETIKYLTNNFIIKQEG